MTLYGVLFEIPSQRTIIERVCYGSCGKILVGSIGLTMDRVQFVVVPCKEPPEGCPAYDRDSTEAVGVVDGCDLHLRKLK